MRWLVIDQENGAILRRQKRVETNPIRVLDCKNPKCQEISARAPTMEQFLEDVNHPAVKANIDVSHLQLAGTRPEELRKLKGKAIHVHISDCDGKVHGDLPPGRGVVNFGPYLREVRDLGIDGSISIELEYSPEPGKIVEWVTEAYTATDRLLREAGIPRSA